MLTPAASLDEEFRRSGHAAIAGVDEAGRGPLAGPVFAAAVILPHLNDLPLILDSKKLSPRTRQALALEIRRIALAWSVASVENNIIDTVNILQATLTAMGDALSSLSLPPDLVLVDGTHPPPYDRAPIRCIRGGDQLSQAVGAASILAKTERDRLMEEYGGVYPQYGFERHKGYGTAEHLVAIAIHGPCPIHRRTFRGVREHCR